MRQGLPVGPRPDARRARRACSTWRRALKRDRAARRRRRAAAGRQARRAAVREAVAADPHRRSCIAVRELGRRGHRAARRTSRSAARESVEDVARNLERWVARRRRPDLRAEAAGALRRRGAAPARRQRAHRRRASVPGAGRHADAAGAARLARRPHAGVRRRRQQRGGLARARGRDARHARAAWRRRPATSCQPIDVAACTRAAAAGGTVTITTDALAAVAGADAVYTDVWASMGQEAEEAVERSRVFAPYQVNERLMRAAGPSALFMHCLPAHRGARSHRRRHRLAGLGRLRSGREPPARAEGAARVLMS